MDTQPNKGWTQRIHDNSKPLNCLLLSSFIAIVSYFSTESKQPGVTIHLSEREREERQRGQCKQLRERKTCFTGSYIT